jgi:hypothetical protein
MTIKERTCPRCGLKMTQLSYQLWQCKCGYKTQGEADADKEDKEAPTRGRRLGGTRDSRFRKQTQSAHKGLRHT